MEYFIRFSLRKHSKFFKILLIALCSVLVCTNDMKAQRINSIRVYPYYPEDWPNVNHSSVPSSGKPTKYFFYTQVDYWKYFKEDDPCTRAGGITLYNSFRLINKNKSNIINPSDISKYIIINPNYGFDFKYGGKWGGLLEDKWSYYYPMGLEFTNEYYDDKINEYELEITMSAANACHERSVKSNNTLILKPLHLSATIKRVGDGCMNTVHVTLKTPGVKGQNIRHLNYSGSAASSLFEPPSSKRIDDDQEEVEFDIPLTKIYANEQKQVEILAYEPGYLPARAILSIEPASGLDISSGGYNQVNSTIPITVQIPDCHKNKFQPIPIKFTYSGDGKEELVNSSTQTIDIPARSSSHTFSLPLKSSDRCAKTLRISASSDHFGNTPPFIDVALPESRKLQLTATHHPKNKNRKEHISVSVHMISCTVNTTTVRLEYGDEKNELIEPPEFINLSGGRYTFDIYLNEKGDRCNAKDFTITAKASGFKDSDLTRVTLPSGGKKSLAFKVNNSQ